jgi:hypothetical protein
MRWLDTRSFDKRGDVLSPVIFPFDSPRSLRRVKRNPG